MQNSIEKVRNLSLTKLEEPQEGQQQTGYISYRENDYERIPSTDTFDSETKETKLKLIAIIGAAVLAVGATIYAGLHGKNILEKALEKTEYEEKGLWEKIKTGFSNFFTGTEKAAKKLKKNTPETPMPPENNPPEKPVNETETHVNETNTDINTNTNTNPPETHVNETEQNVEQNVEEVVENATNNLEEILTETSENETADVVTNKAKSVGFWGKFKTKLKKIFKCKTKTAE